MGTGTGKLTKSAVGEENMKSLHSLAVVVVLGLSSLLYAQETPKPETPPKTEAQKSFDQLKTLAGSWQGTMSIDPPSKEFDGKTVQLTLRVTSLGNALMHEMKVAGRPDDPITMLYLDGDRLLLTHYCDAGNRPRMVGKMAPDAKTIAFDFLDLSGSKEHGYMQKAAFTAIDPDHHVEEWTFGSEGKGVRAH